MKFSDDVVIKAGAVVVEAFGDENGDIDNITGVISANSPWWGGAS